MSKFTLKRTGLPSLSFEGRILAESRGDRSLGKAGGRAHDIAVYRAEDGQLILAVNFVSPHCDETSDHIVEAVDSLEEIEAWLCIYDPNEHIASTAFNSPQHLQAARTAIQRAFDEQTIRILNLIEQQTRTFN